MDSDEAVRSRNKELIRNWFEEVWNEGNESAIDEMRAPDVLSFGLGESEAPAKAAEFKVFYHRMRAAIPDLHVTVEDVIAEGDKVVARISIEGTHCGAKLGVEATGKRVNVDGLIMARVREGKIAETWTQFDKLALLKQVDAIPASSRDRFFE
jgi:steroid delta-isomerase-like uncharacterized protein